MARRRGAQPGNKNGRGNRGKSRAVSFSQSTPRQFSGSSGSRKSQSRLHNTINPGKGGKVNYGSRSALKAMNQERYISISGQKSLSNAQRAGVISRRGSTSRSKARVSGAKKAHFSAAFL